MIVFEVARKYQMIRVRRWDYTVLVSPEKLWQVFDYLHEVPGLETIFADDKEIGFSVKKTYNEVEMMKLLKLYFEGIESDC